MSKLQPSFAALLIALVIAFPCEAAKKKSKRKPKARAKVTETVPNDLPPMPEEDSPPGSENALSGEPASTESAIGAAPVSDESAIGSEPPLTEQSEEAPPVAEAAAPAMMPPSEPPPLDDDREPAQMGPSQGAAMTADTPPPSEELTPGEPPPEMPAPPSADPLVDNAPDSAPPDEPPADAPPAEAPPLRAAKPEPEPKAETVTTTEPPDSEPPSEAVAEEPPPPPMDDERLPPTDYEEVKKKRAEERRLRERTLTSREDKKMEEEYPVLKRGDFKVRRKLAEEDGSLTATASRDYTWQSPRHYGLDIQYSPVQYKSLELGGSGAYANKQGNGARVNFEWMFLQEFGKLSFGLGVQYDNLPAASSVSGEALTVTALGAEASFTYRLDLVQHQILVPFARFGMNGAYAVQNRADNSVASQGSYRGMLWGAGAELCLFIFEKTTARLLDRNFGINETYLVFEYVKSSNSKSGVQPDLSHDEFRFGMRFEI